MNIRSVKLSDAGQIVKIYDYYIENSVATFETKPIEKAEMERRIGETVAIGYPFFVAEDEGAIVGYAYGHQYRAREAYRHTIEISVYIKDISVGKGIAALLYESLFTAIEAGGFHAIVAGISLPNEASVRLHEKFGMTQVAHFKEVGFKFGRWVDTGFWQKVLNK